MQERFRSPRVHTRFTGQVVEAQVVLISYYTDHRAPPGKRKAHAGCLCLDGCYSATFSVIWKRRTNLCGVTVLGKQVIKVYGIS